MRLAKSVVTWMVNARSSIDEMRAPAMLYIACVEQSTLATAHEIGGSTDQEGESKDPNCHGKTQLGFLILFPRA